MIEYLVYTKLTIPKMRQLWELCFKNDSKWFYGFYSGRPGYIKIRCSGRKRKLEKYCDSKGIDFSFAEYVEGVQSVNRYLPEFVSIFHGFAEMMMKCKGKHRKQIDERCIHLLMNMNNMSYLDEAEFLSHQVINKARVAGRLG